MNILFISLGCDKNRVDSEYMLSSLVQDGFTVTDDETRADVIIVNTCCFILDALQESIDTLLDMAEYKKNGSCRALIVTGCMSQRYQDEIRQEIPEVDACIGTNSTEDILSAVHQALEGKHFESFKPLDRLEQHPNGRCVSTGGYYAYLKIAEGCDKHCTYCIIPSLRGPYRSVPMEQLVQEAEMLAAGGTRELILVAQETTVYGTDLTGKKMIPELLERLNAVDGIEWIRLMYCYPEEIDDALLDAINRLPKVCHYLDMPIQHINSDILKRMGRKTNRQELLKKIARIREKIPDITLRTTLISGFPGETQQQHQELLDFVRDVRFDRLGVFPYSQEEGTPAASFADQVDENLREERRDEIMALQQQISRELNEELIDSRMEVMIEGRMADEPDTYVGRSRRDAPDVDGLVFLKSYGELLSGDLVTVRITGYNEYDLIGELTNEPA